MSAIIEALKKLDQSIGKLESNATTLETALAGQQRDMFPDNASNENSESTGTSITKDEIADRLDQAIETVEKLLKEG